MEGGGLRLEHLPPGHPDRPVGEGEGGDIYARLAASHQRIVGQDTKDFPMPLDGLIVRYRRVGLEKYRQTADISQEWERWAQLLIDGCVGFYDVNEFDLTDPANRDMEPPFLLDGLGQPVTWQTLGERIGITIDEDRGVRGLVLDIFAFEESLADHAQRVDAWMSTAAVDQGRRLAKGS